jgi:hypothetical protein
MILGGGGQGQDGRYLGLATLHHFIDTEQHPIQLYLIGLLMAGAGGAEMRHGDKVTTSSFHMGGHVYAMGISLDIPGPRATIWRVLRVVLVQISKGGHTGYGIRSVSLQV